MGLQKIVRGTMTDSLTSARRGWVVGHFMDKGSLAHTENTEVRLWEHKPGVPYGKKAFSGPEFIIVFTGALIFVLGEEPTVSEEWVRAGEYIILPGGILKEVRAPEHSTGVTVRWPSVPDGNKIVQAPR